MREIKVQHSLPQSGCILLQRLTFHCCNSCAIPSSNMNQLVSRAHEHVKEQVFFPPGVDYHTPEWLSTWWAWPWWSPYTCWCLAWASGLHSSPGRRRRKRKLARWRPSCWPTATSAGWSELLRCQVTETSVNKSVHLRLWPLTPTYTATSESFSPRSWRNSARRRNQSSPTVCGASSWCAQGRSMLFKVVLALTRKMEIGLSWWLTSQTFF